MDPITAQAFLDSIGYIPGVSGTRGMPEAEVNRIKDACRALALRDAQVVPVVKVDPYHARTEADMEPETRPERMNPNVFVPDAFDADYVPPKIRKHNKK